MEREFRSILGNRMDFGCSVFSLIKWDNWRVDTIDEGVNKTAAVRDASGGTNHKMSTLVKHWEEYVRTIFCNTSVSGSLFVVRKFIMLFGIMSVDCIFINGISRRVDTIDEGVNKTAAVRDASGGTNHKMSTLVKHREEYVRTIFCNTSVSGSLLVVRKFIMLFGIMSAYCNFLISVNLSESQNSKMACLLRKTAIFTFYSFVT
jgi:hypothetical protein